MILLSQNIGALFSMLLLLVVSAFFSGTETAFFNLTGRQIAKMASSGHRNRLLTALLLKKPKRLLTTLLLGNMAVNVLYFSFTSSLTVKFAETSGTVATAFAATAFILLVLFGEMLPKSFAYANSTATSAFVAVPTFLCIYLFSPVRIILNWLLVVPALRLLKPPAKKKHQISTHQFKLLIESSRNKGLISSDENQFLNAVIDLSILKIRHIMRPRVDMIFCDIDSTVQRATEKIKSNNSRTCFLYSGKMDNIVGMITIRQLLLYPEGCLRELASEVDFIPEQKNVESLLESFLDQSYDTAVVVDEYGQIAGVVCLDDIIDNVLGSEPTDGQVKPAEQIGPMTYRLAGNLSIHNWAEDFGIDYGNCRFSTVAGLTTALLGKVPKKDDVARIGNLKFTVEKVLRNRIQSIILSFEPIKDKKI
ncbi:MAG: hemolysin family protein [Anaerohalosphaeraceae bacterium]|nr:hemolysin family protein [Anaerohalosphaeraceae bacterium]